MSEEKNMICGRSYTVSPPQKPKWRSKRVGVRQPEPKPRFLVDGITHKNGALIRFRSLENAERHIRTMKLAKGE